MLAVVGMTTTALVLALTSCSRGFALLPAASPTFPVNLPTTLPTPTFEPTLPNLQATLSPRRPSRPRPELLRLGFTLSNS